MSKMLKKELYTLRFKLRRTSHIKEPVINNIRDLSIPRDAIYHYLDPEGINHGPRASEPLMKNVEGIRYIRHITEFFKTEIPPIRKLGGNITTMATEFRMKNRSFRPLRDLAKNMVDPKALAIMNYSLLSAAWTFPQSARSGWYMYQALLTTLLDGINECAKISKRDQFFFVELPDEMPTLGTLKEVANNLSNPNIAKLPSFETKFVFDLFRYVGRKHDESSFKQLSKDGIARLNIVFTRLDKWIVVPMAWLIEFHKTLGRRGIYDERQFEIILIALLNTLHEEGRPFMRAAEIEEDDSEGLTDEEEDELIVAQMDPKTRRGIPDVSVMGSVEEEQATAAEKRELLSLDLDDLMGGETFDTKLAYDDGALKVLEEELMVLDRAREARDAIIELDDEELDALGRTVEETSINIDVLSELSAFEPDTSKTPSMRLADTLYNTGVMTAREHSRIERLSKAFDKITDPYGSEVLLSETLSVDVKDVTVAPVELLDDPVILDDSLKRATVDTFEKQYITKGLRKNITASLSAIQKGPVSITGYKVNRVKDALNDYEEHVLSVSPVVGAPSTIRQILPVVREDGTFKFKGVDYRMRMQRVDVPIRKISPTQVALSSYYGKLFVETSQLVAQNYSRFLCNYVRLEVEEGRFKGSLSTRPENVPGVPVVYYNLSTEVMWFEIPSKVKLCFSHSNRVKVLGADDVALKHERKGFVLVGSKGKVFYYIDSNGWISSLEDGVIVRLMRLEDFIGMDTGTRRVPLPSIDLKIYSKSISSGFCLAYLLGLDGLLKVLGSKPRRVLAGQRVQLNSSEYAIRFKDQTLVFDRSNNLETMILSGFQVYDRLLKEYPVNVFDQKDIYSLILDKAGVGSRYVKKLDSMNSYFVDPITADVLKMMNEPVEFIPLVMRACEMLNDGYVPKRVEDPKSEIGDLTRLRGYERIAGFAYENMVKAVETFASRNYGGRSSITINPYDTVKVITEDPTVAPVNNLNPVQYLREREVMTPTGRGGRSKRSMVARTRVYQDTDMGLVSEASVDSGDVGVIIYASQDAAINSIYGTVGKHKGEVGSDYSAAQLLSTGTLMSPNADGDDR